MIDSKLPLKLSNLPAFNSEGEYYQYRSGTVYLCNLWPTRVPCRRLEGSSVAREGKPAMNPAEGIPPPGSWANAVCLEVKLQSQLDLARILEGEARRANRSEGSAEIVS